MEKAKKEKIIEGLTTSIILLLALTLNDILVVRYVFLPLSAWDLISYYHIAIWMVMTYSLYFICFYLSKDWRSSIYLYLFLTFGLEDTLYYWLGLKPIPDRLTWLWGQPTAPMLIIHNLIGIALVFVFEYIESKYNLWEELLKRLKYRVLVYVVLLIIMNGFTGLLYFIFPKA
ncbi:MAG: hypothetical protein ACTSU2_17590 [Promethearchaeota archaeon]